jgi:hypothetical protein
VNPRDTDSDHERSECNGRSEALRRSAEAMGSGLVIPAEDVLAEMRQILAEKTAAGTGPDVRQAIEELKAFRKGNTLGEGVTIRELIEEGRRF